MATIPVHHLFLVLICSCISINHMRCAGGCDSEVIQKCPIKGEKWHCLELSYLNGLPKTFCAIAIAIPRGQYPYYIEGHPLEARRCKNGTYNQGDTQSNKITKCEKKDKCLKNMKVIDPEVSWDRTTAIVKCDCVEGYHLKRFYPVCYANNPENYRCLCKLDKICKTGTGVRRYEGNEQEDCEECPKGKYNNGSFMSCRSWTNITCAMNETVMEPNKHHDRSCGPPTSMSLQIHTSTQSDSTTERSGESNAEMIAGVVVSIVFILILAAIVGVILYRKGKCTYCNSNQDQGSKTTKDKDRAGEKETMLGPNDANRASNDQAKTSQDDIEKGENSQQQPDNSKNREPQPDNLSPPTQVSGESSAVQETSKKNNYDDDDDDEAGRLNNINPTDGNSDSNNPAKFTDDLNENLQHHTSSGNGNCNNNRISANANDLTNGIDSLPYIDEDNSINSMSIVPKKRIPST